MESNNYKNERFDSFLNQTIILTSRTYFKKQMNTAKKENTILDNENYSVFLQGFIDVNAPLSSIDQIEDIIQLEYALKSLSAIEQAVIFLLYNKDLSQKDASEILEIYAKTISKIKLRAIDKLREIMEGDQNNEK